MASDEPQDPRRGRPPGSDPAPASAEGEAAVGSHNIIEVDTSIPADDDEGYQTDGKSTASTSLSSSVRDYVFENNRRYHRFKEGRYLIPNDNQEQEREDMKHVLVLHICGGKLHFAPLANPKRILDIGTGTGIWAIDMGDEYRDADIIYGIDLSPIQPSWVPPNVKFLVDDAEADWLYEPGSLDFIHARHMSVAIKDWPRLLQQAYKALKPGGWVELQDVHFLTHSDDGTIPETYQYAEFIRLFTQSFRNLGFDLDALTNNSQWLKEAGFVNISEKQFKIPIGTWPKDQTLKMAGLYNRSIVLDFLQAATTPLMRGLGWSKEEVEVFLIGVRKDALNNSIHSYYTLHVYYAQKPLDASS